jgi:hypothetical protein
LPLGGDSPGSSEAQQYGKRDLTAILKEVKEQLQELAVPVKGVISDGEDTLESAIAFVFPQVPHQLCQFHSLKDAIDPLYEADRHAKTQLKKQRLRVRPIERALEERITPENEAIRGYCLAVRASLTDDGRSPLPRFWSAVVRSRDPGERLHCPYPGKKRLPPALKQLQQPLSKGIKATATLWPPLQSAYGLVHQAAQILANPPPQSGAQVRERYLAHICQMREQKAKMGPRGH